MRETATALVRLRRSSTRWIAAAAITFLPIACKNGDNGDFDFNSNTAGTGGGPAGDDGTGTTSDATGSGEGDTTSDLAPTSTGDSGTDDAGSDTGSETEDLPSVPCTSLDVLFVIDNSDTMSEEQLRLQSTAAAWIDQLNAQTPTVVDDVRVAVIATDDSSFAQSDGAGTACGPYAGGEPWMTLGETLATELPCALAQGVAGDPDERPMQMLQAALSDENLAPGGAHDGFLRDEGLLVIVLLTDEEDDLEAVTQWGSAGDPPDWVDAISGKKGGVPGNVVVISLLGHDKPNACPAFQWDGMEGAELSPRLIEFTESFPQGAVGDICAAEYATFLFSIVPGVAAACDNYVP